MTTKRLSAAEFWETLYGRHDPHSCTFAAICAFAEAYASAQPRWIAVSEGLPEEVENGFRWVQVWDKYWNTMYFATWTGEDWEPVSERAPEHEITHWQPLPDAPEGDQS